MPDNKEPESEGLPDDPLQRPWCCFGCSSKFVFGKARTKPGSPHIHCPNCGSPDLHPIHEPVREIEEYLGEIGTLQ